MSPKKQNKILVAEDDAAMRDIICHKLKASGFIVVEAPDGHAAADLFISEKPDLVLLDLLMPEMNGFQVLEGIRKSSEPAAAKIPVIVLSNLWSNKDILQAEALKVQAYMVKAYFDTNDILKKINEVLEKVENIPMPDLPPAAPAVTTLPCPSPAFLIYKSVFIYKTKTPPFLRKGRGYF